MKYNDWHSGSNRRNTANIELSLSEILPVYVADRLYLSVAVTGDKYCIFGWIQVAVEIYCGEPWNLANWPTEI